ncbi:MAG: efflux RND transporter permease subunit, partial [Chloroflexi bacterium]|nr:efflux RND transporter permease subunit [Chloroflexota bacterium]
IYAMTGLNQEMLPRVEFPQTIIVAQWPDAEDADQFLEQVTIPLEDNLSIVEGVVNVESTTNPGFAFIIVRYDFGLNQERLSADLQAAVDNAGLPEGVDPELLNFSLSDLPVVVASLSSSELSLDELKTLVETDIQPRLETLDDVNQVSITGGQELPDEDAVVVAETAVSDPDPEPTAEPEVANPGLLPTIVVEGAKALGIEITHAQEISVEMLAGLSEQENAAEQVLAVLNLLPHHVLPYLPADTMSFLPIEYIELLDADLVAQLDETAAEFGGVGQYTIVEATTILAGDTVAEEPEEPVEDGSEVVEETAVLPEVTPIELPDSWIAASASAGFELIVTSDITPEVMGGIAGVAPALLAELTPEMWRAIDPAAVAVVLPVVAETLDPALNNQLLVLQRAANGETPEPVMLPASWIAAADYAG